MKRFTLFVTLSIALFMPSCFKKPNPLFAAIQKVSLPEVRNAIAKGANVNGKDQDGVPCLNLAVLSGSLEIVLALIDAGADVNAINNSGLTPLMRAAQLGQADIVEALLKAKADVNKECPHGTPLSLAVKHGHKNIVVRLLEAGADANFGKYTGNPVAEALRKREREVVNILLDAGSKKGLHDVLRNAIYLRYSEIAGKILSVTPDLAHDEYTFYLACENDNSELVNLFLKNGATFSNKSLTAAVKSGRLELIKMILEKGTDVNIDAPDIHTSMTALMLAARSGRIDIMRYLLDKGANIDKFSQWGESALTEAARSNFPDTVRFLLENGADVNAKSDNLTGSSIPAKFIKQNEPNIKLKRMRYKTAIVSAIEDGLHAEIVELLLAHKAEIPPYALYDSAVKGNYSIADVLLKHGENIDRYDTDGLTALLTAVEWNDPATVKWLLDRKADFTLKDVNGHTPLAIAREKKLAEIEQLLLDAGAKE